MTQRSTRANIPITMMFGQVPSLLQDNDKSISLEGEISRSGAHTNDPKREENSCQKVPNGNESWQR